MAINDMTVEQSSTILAAALSQAQGGVAVSTPITSADFVTVGQLALKTGYDTLSTAISQVLSKTIFAVRPYNRKFKFLEADAVRYGNHVRKINYVDDSLENSAAYSLTDGAPVDMQVVRKPKVIQTNFYGYNTFDYHQTVYRQQLETALRGPEEWAGFIGGLMQHIQNIMEQTHEESARLTVANLIAGTSALNNTTQVFPLLTAYNAFTGQSLTATTIYDPANYPDFSRFFSGVLQNMSRAMAERSESYHYNLTAGTIMRHTPVEDQRLITLAPEFTQIAARVYSTTFNDEYLKLIPREEVFFWQNRNLPDEINLDAGYIDANGDPDHGSVTLSKVFAVLFDREAAGYTTVNQSYEVAPYNVRGKYWNHFWSFQDRYWNDFTENCVIFTLT